MSDATSQRQATAAWRILFERMRVLFWPREVPAHPPASRLSPRDDWLRRLDRTRDLLEQTRSSLERYGWTCGAWFSVSGASGVRRLGTAEPYGLLNAGSEV